MDTDPNQDKNPNELKKTFKLSPAFWIASLLAILLGGGALIYVSVFLEADREIKQLQASEVREYQGERLDSLVDLQTTTITSIQHLDRDIYQLQIDGLVDDQLSLSYDQVLDRQQYEKVVALHCVTGWDANILWTGVLVEDLIDQAGVQEGATTVIFYASDGFSTSLPLDYIRDNDIVLAHQVNHVELPESKGFPFQLVAQSKWGYKWIKWLTRIELSDDADYRGTYESSGYNNDGDVSGPKREE